MPKPAGVFFDSRAGSWGTSAPGRAEIHRGRAVVTRSGVAVGKRGSAAVQTRH